MMTVRDSQIPPEHHPPRPPCKRCGGQMLRGHALQNTLSGSSDFPGDELPVTLSRTGPAQVVPCLKCLRCGYSISA